MMTSTNSAIQAVKKLAEECCKAHLNRFKMEPLCDAGDLSSRWNSIAISLLPKKDQSEIQEKFTSNDQRLFEVILRSHNNGQDWGAIKEAVPNCDEMLDAYKEDFDRICHPTVDQMHRQTENAGQQLFPKCSTCYDDEWLNKVQFDPFPYRYNIQVHEKDVPNIIPAIKICAKIWHDIGMRLEIHEGELETIDCDETRVEGKIRKMLYAWVYAGETNTWQNLIEALIANRDPYSSLNVDSVKLEKEEMLRKKKAALQGLRELLNVESGVSDDHVIVNLGNHIRRANLRTEQISELVGKIELLEDTMSQYSKSLSKWANDLKKDLETSTDIREILFDKKQKLERLQHRLERNATRSGSSWAQDTSDKLKRVNNEFENAVKELEHANSDYEAISNMLNVCLMELEASVEQYEELHHAIQSCRSLTMKDVLEITAIIAVDTITTATNAFNTGVSEAGRSIGGDVGAAAGGAVGTLLGGALGIGLSILRSALILPVGTVMVGVHKLRDAYYKYSLDWDERFQKLSETSLKQLEEIRSELQDIQDKLNKAKHA